MAGPTSDTKATGASGAATTGWWAEGGEQVAWTEHDGPGRPPAGPSANTTTGLALAWAGWLAISFVGCMVFHDRSTIHVHSPWGLDVLMAATFLLAMPVVFAVAKGRAIGLWFSSLVGIGIAYVSLTQWSVAPAYTAIEAGGFVALAGTGAVLAVRAGHARHAARHQRRGAPGAGSTAAGTPLVPTAAPALASAPGEQRAPEAAGR